MPKIGNTFGQALRKVRDAEDLTQAELAKKIGLSQKIISDWESDKKDPSLENLKKLCEVLKISSTTFIELDESYASIMAALSKNISMNLNLDVATNDLIRLTILFAANDTKEFYRFVRETLADSRK